MKTFILTLLFLFASAHHAVAFTPYENRLLSGEKQRVGMMALADASEIEQLKVSAQHINANALTDIAIENLSIYVKPHGENALVFAYFETSEKGISGWGQRLKNASGELKQLTSLLKPHKRADRQYTWLRMEWMNHIASDTAFPHSNSSPMKMGLVSGLKPEHELDYRFLHQTNWPGVVDTMVNTNYRNWTTFMVEIGSELFLFTYAEYIGNDIKADNQRMGQDPTTQRWWSHTEKCLINLHGEGNWSGMESIIPEFHRK